MQNPWTKEEIEYLKKNYSTSLNRDLSKTLNRGLGAISYIAFKLTLKKDKVFFAKSRKKTNIEFSKEILQRMYTKEKKSTRKIASELGVGKTTIEYYFKKYKIPLRNHSASNKIRFLTEDTWNKGLNKNKDPRVRHSAEKAKETYKKKRLERLKKIEEEYNIPLKIILGKLYWEDKLTQEKIAIKLGIDRSIIIELMNTLNISKRPNFEFISSLKGKDRPMYGKTWEDLHGSKKALKRKRDASLRFRELIIKRLQNNEMPFLNTRIEKLIANEMSKRGIFFRSQFSIDHKFVCDFAIPEYKIAIECDGDYWHANPRIYDHNALDVRQRNKVQRDKFKKKYLTRRGWLLLSFFESDIKSNLSACVDQIEHAIKNK